MTLNNQSKNQSQLAELSERRSWRFAHPRTMGTRNRLHPWHPRHRHRCQKQSFQKSYEGLGPARTWEKEEVPWALPQTTSTFHTIRSLHRRPHWKRREGHPSETVCPTCWEVGQSVFTSVWICQCTNEHCNRPSHTLMLTWVAHPNEPDEQSPTSVGRSGWPQPVSLLKSSNG